MLEHHSDWSPLSTLPQKCLKFNVDAPIWLSKQRILCTLNQSLKDVLNYGLFQPAYNGKAGKFLDEERQLREYPFPSLAPVPYLEVGLDRVCVCVCVWERERLYNGFTSLREEMVPNATNTFWFHI